MLSCLSNQSFTGISGNVKFTLTGDPIKKIRVDQVQGQFFPGFTTVKINEPPHDKTNKMTVRPAKTHIRLGILPVRSESSLCTQ